MGPLVDLDDLVSTHVIVARLNWRRVQRLHTARVRYDFPEPVKTLSRTMLWLWPDIEEWAFAHGWERWPPEPPDADRALILPSDVVPGTVIEARLGIPTSDGGVIEELAGLRTGPVNPPSYLWSDAEQLWHNQANRSHSPKRRPDSSTEDS